jgi:transposase
VTYTDNDYSETDIAGLAGISLRTAFREIPKFESVGLIVFTRKVGRAKMYKLNPSSEAAKHLQQFAFDIATKRIDNTMKSIESRQQKLVIDAREEDMMMSKQEG